MISIGCLRRGECGVTVYRKLKVSNLSAATDRRGCHSDTPARSPAVRSSTYQTAKLTNFLTTTNLFRSIL